jgi:protein TonB
MRPIISFLSLTVIVVLSNPFVSSAQTAKPDSVVAVVRDTAHKEGPYFRIEIESEFPGGSKAWFAFLNTHLTYPKKAVRKKIEGTVVLQFIVDKDGSVSDMKAISGDPLLAEAAVTAMTDTPRWSPAVQDGKYVKSYKKQPIVFRLQ